MGNGLCYSNRRRNIRNNTSTLVSLTNGSQGSNSRVRQYYTFHDKLPAQHLNRIKITTKNTEEKQFVNLFLIPYYNIEILTDNFNNEQECAICFEPFCQQDIIARLECLCIYHKHCLDEWNQRKRCCPLHMDKIIVKKFISSTQIISE